MIETIGGQIIFVFIFFSRKRNRYDIIGNEYDVDISVILKHDSGRLEKYIENNRNP